MSWDVVLYDGNGPGGAFAPNWNKSKPTGGTEVHMVQLAEGLAAAGLKVLGISAISTPEYHGATYLPAGDPLPVCKALVTCGISQVPVGVRTDRHAVLWTHDPANGILPLMEHLRYSDFVCVSQWQASRFPLGFRTHVIPAIIDDWIYELGDRPLEKRRAKFVCLSAWWKGSMDTLILWEELKREKNASRLAELHMGSPYSHPPAAQQIVERAGCTWVPLHKPADVVEQMKDAAGVFRVCKFPETFGATDVIAQILGCRVHVLALNGIGALHETLASPVGVTAERRVFDRNFRFGYGNPPDTTRKDYRARTIIPRWIDLLRLR